MIMDMILINVIERENKKKYINISNEADRMEGVIESSLTFNQEQKYCYRSSDI